MTVPLVGVARREQALQLKFINENDAAFLSESQLYSREETILVVIKRERMLWVSGDGGNLRDRMTQRFVAWDFQISRS